MTESTRWVIIDDRDSRIEYSGTWNAVSGDTYNSQGNFGLVYRNTLQGSNTDASSFSFSFTGNAARIMGTNDLKIDANGVADPDWDCVLDGKVVAKNGYFQYTENNWGFCTFSNLVAGQHSIGLTVKTKGRSFWFDQIQYRPTATVQNEVVAATRDDADLTYSTGWGPLGSVGHNTLIKGSTATFRFIGSGVSLWAMYPRELPHNPGEATYAIGDGSPVTFTIPGGGDTSHYNRRIFEVSGLSPQAHTIKMTYQSTGGSTPLVVSQMFIEGGTNLRAPAPGGEPAAGGSSVAQGATAASTDSSASPSPLPVGTADIFPSADDVTSLASSVSSATVFLPGASSSPTVGNSGSGNKNSGAGAPSETSGGGGQVGNSEVGGASTGRAPIGAIIGGVLGALAVLILLLWLIWLRRRKRIRLQGYPSHYSAFTLTRDDQQTPATAGPLHAQQPGSSVMMFPDTPPVHPAAHSKRGPVFNSPFISNHNIYQQFPIANMSIESSAHLIPQTTNTSSQGHHHVSGSISQSVSAVSQYTDNGTNASSRQIFHEDSGVRLPIRPPSEIVEYPPMYTAR